MRLMEVRAMSRLSRLSRLARSDLPVGLKRGERHELGTVSEPARVSAQLFTRCPCSWRCSWRSRRMPVLPGNRRSLRCLRCTVRPWTAHRAPRRRTVAIV